MINMDALPLSDQQYMRDIFSGKILVPLYSDAVAKRILNADVHPERLNFLLQNIAKDPTIDVASGAGQESFKQSLHSKSMISDIPSWLKDGRISDLEVQKIKQDFIFTRVELYASDMLLLQYSVTEGELKGDLNYTNVNGALIIVLMVDSPKAFKEYDKECDKYIHRFTRMTADTGLSYPTKAKMMYVQLDKCLKQYKQGKNAEAEDGKPDRLQLWLSMFADVNDDMVKVAAEKDEILMKIRQEALDMAQDKEVQSMLIQEKYDRMDWLTYGNEQRKQGREEGLTEGEIRGAVQLYHDEMNLSPVDIIRKIKIRYNLDESEAEKYVEETLNLQPV